MNLAAILLFYFVYEAECAVMGRAGGTDCFSLCLFAVLFHVSQPSSVIYLGSTVVPADPSPHRALLLSTAAH